MRKIILVVTAIGIVAGAGWAWAAIRPSRSQTISVRHEDLSASDLARASRQHFIKLRVLLPEDEYTVNLWMEEWKKGESSPAIHMLATMGSGKMHEEAVLFSVPTDRNPEWFFGLNGAATWGHLDSLAGPEGAFTSAEESPINPDDDLYLAKVVAQGKDGSSVGGQLKSVDSRDAVTYVYKARFSRGDVGNKPEWTNGRLVFSQWAAAKKETK